MNKPRSVKGIDDTATMIIVRRIDVGSYEALNKGKKGIGNKTHIHRLDTITNSFHLFLTRCFRNDDRVGEIVIIRITWA